MKNSTNLLLLFTLLLSMSFVHAQSIEWRYWETNYQGQIENIEELITGELFTTEITNIAGIVTPVIRKFDEKGEIIQSKNFEYSPYHIGTTYAIGNVKDQTILTFSSIYIAENSWDLDSNYTLITVWDYDLNIINQRKYYTGQRGFGQYQGQWTGENEIALVGTIGNPSAGEDEEYESVFFKITGQGELLLLEAYKNGHWQFWSHDICKTLDGTGYLSGGSFFRVLDNDFSILRDERLILGQSPGDQFTIRQWNDTSYIFAGSGFDPNEDNGDGLIIHIIDDSLRSIKYIILGIIWDFGFPIKCLDGYDRDNMYFAAFSFSQGIIKLYNFDSELNINWQKEYKFDESYLIYRGWDMIATLDGGCAMVGTVINYQEEVGNPFILKVSKDPNASLDLPDYIQQTITLYPNPSFGDLRIDLVGNTNVDMTIYDVQGQKCFVQNGLKEGINTLDMAKLMSGIYFVHLTKNGALISSQRWVKQ